MNQEVKGLVPKGALLGENGVPLTVMKTGDGEGALQPVIACRGFVELREGFGVTTIQGKSEVDAEGYRKLNQLAGLSIITPPFVNVEGAEQGNPFYERNDETKAIERIIIRKIVFGYSPLGQPVAVDKTLHLDVRAYWNMALAKIIKWHPAAGCIGLRSRIPEKFWIYAEDESGRRVRKDEIAAPDGLAFFAGSAGPDVGVWIDLSHPEITSAWQNQQQMQQFLSRRAETTVTRLALQEHPAIAAKKVELIGGVARIPVYFHRHGLSFEEQEDLARRISSGREELGGVAVQADVVVGSAAGEEVDREAGGDIDESHEAPEGEQNWSNDEHLFRGGSS